MFKAQDVARANGFPQIRVAPNGKIGFCSTSDDGGHTWSSASRVNDVVHNGSDQFFQWLAVDPVTGHAYVLSTIAAIHKIIGSRV